MEPLQIGSVEWLWPADAVSLVPASIGGGGFLELAILFIVLALIAAVIGARGVAGISMTVAKWFIIVFIILAVISLVL